VVACVHLVRSATSTTPACAGTLIPGGQQCTSVTHSECEGSYAQLSPSDVWGQCGMVDGQCLTKTLCAKALSTKFFVEFGATGQNVEAGSASLALKEEVDKTKNLHKKVESGNYKLTYTAINGHYYDKWRKWTIPAGVDPLFDGMTGCTGECQRQYLIEGASPGEFKLKIYSRVPSSECGKCFEIKVNGKSYYSWSRAYESRTTLEDPELEVSGIVGQDGKIELEFIHDGEGTNEGCSGECDTSCTKCPGSQYGKNGILAVNGFELLQ